MHRTLQHYGDNCTRHMCSHTAACGSESRHDSLTSAVQGVAWRSSYALLGSCPSWAPVSFWQITARCCWYKKKFALLLLSQVEILFVSTLPRKSPPSPPTFLSVKFSLICISTRWHFFCVRCLLFSVHQRICVLSAQESSVWLAVPVLYENKTLCSDGSSPRSLRSAAAMMYALCRCVGHRWTGETCSARRFMLHLCCGSLTHVFLLYWTLRLSGSFAPANRIRFVFPASTKGLHVED